MTASAQSPSASDVIETAMRHQNLGLAHLEESQPSKAISEFEALVDIISEEAIGYGNLAVAYLRLQKSEEAEVWVKQGLEVAPMDSQLHFILAEVYQWQGKTEEMVAEIQEAVKLAPERLGDAIQAGAPLFGSTERTRRQSSRRLTSCGHCARRCPNKYCGAAPVGAIAPAT